ncbi:MAG: FKBP-type peptidyl-prolyl cis-trans isomerase [Nitriliruptorales bacterium]|nr:FKBP-type peptidyl-prolyl cis-trans isomerase [Nitriliruptorales bacterium]
MRWRRLVLVLAGTALSLTACSGDDGGEPPAPASPSPTENLTAKPEFEIPDGAPPGELQTRVLVEADGPEVQAGDTVTVHYVGKAWSTGEQFDASWDRDRPLVFEFGGGQMIEGWERGMAGMRVGERRMIIIPPDLAYGDRGVPDAGIEPGETLVFVVDLLDVNGP